MEKKPREKKISITEQLKNANNNVAILENKLRTVEGNHDFTLENIKNLLDTVIGNCSNDCDVLGTFYRRPSDTVNVKQKITNLIMRIAQQNAGSRQAFEIANSEIAWLRSIIGAQVGVTELSRRGEQDTMDRCN